MRVLIAGLLALVLTGCGEQTGRYQLVASVGAPDAVWLLDTAKGDISICIRNQAGAIQCWLWGK